VDDFRHASDQLSALGISAQAQAEALGVAYQTFRIMRLDPEASGYRRPPPESSWRSAFARLALERATDLQRLAGELAG
jgi:hypothetical protein